MFEAGGTYGGFTLRGSGAFAVSTYENTFASSHATAQANCLAGGAAAQVLADAVASGDPDPSVWDDLYCSQIAKETAMPAAFAAADAVSSWITVGRYGTGTNPILDGGGTQDAGIYLERTGTGGWIFQDMTIQNFDRAGIDYENYAGSVDTGGTGTGVTGSGGNGVILRRLDINNIRRLCTAYGVGTGTDCIVHPQGNGTNTGNWPAMAGYLSFHANGFVLAGLNYIRVQDLTFANTDGPFYLLWGRHYWLDNVTSNASYWEHPYFNAASWVMARNNHYREHCWLGYPDGAAQIFLAGTRDFTFRDSSLRRSLRAVSPLTGLRVSDGSSFHCEANCIRTLVDNFQGCGAGADGCAGQAMAWIANPIPADPKHQMTLVMNSLLREYNNDGTSNQIGVLVSVSGATPTQQGRALFIRNDFYPFLSVPPVGVNSLWQSTPPASFTRPPGWYEYQNNLH